MGKFDYCSDGQYCLDIRIKRGHELESTVAGSSELMTQEEVQTSDGAPSAASTPSMICPGASHSEKSSS